MELWIATSNPGKLTEFKTLFDRLVREKKWTLHSQKELPVFTSPPETGETFVSNARIKAKALKSVKTGVWVIGEDSGLMVDGLGGLPGVHSARYAGPKASDSENCAKLLKMMTIRPMPHRQARFVSTIVAFSPGGDEHVFEGHVKGEIARAAKGSTGFGYDSVFVPEGQSQTLAELGPAFKNRVSHRFQVASLFIEKIYSGE